jgi:GntR family transcriptional regulator
MEFRIDAAGRDPIYRQIADQVREGVARGWLAPHEQLPSSRELARTLVINPNTVVHAYAELERHGVLYTRPGLGVFVAEPKAELTKQARRRRLLEILDRFLTEAVHLGFSEEEVLRLVSARTEQFQWGPAKPEVR